EQGREAIERAGAECWIGDPGRLATLRGSLDGVTIACWMLASASGQHEALAALHGERLAYFLMQVIDTTVRGFLYEAHGLAEAGAERVLAHGRLNAIPTEVLSVDPEEEDAWLLGAEQAIEQMLTRG
ncbi:MAG TPA: hypothetical protein VH025_07785, partial [Solirubrobacteraceae bacterium]|nr:hypothetical protein [Solirubrobacteraceae bacterium]